MKDITMVINLTRTRSIPPREAFSAMTSKIDMRLTQAIDDFDDDPSVRFRSSDLVPLTAKYDKLKKNLRVLVQLVNTYAKTTERMQASRTDLVRHLATMSDSTPLHNEIGKELDYETKENLDRIQNPDVNCLPGDGRPLIVDSAESCTSLYMVQTFASVQASVNAKEFHEHIVEYATEWEQIVTQRVEEGLKEVKKLQNDRMHYEKKIESLRRASEKATEKGRPASPKEQDKLQRNESKLQDAYEIHEEEANRLCKLLQAVTEEGWRDYYTLVKNYMKFECNRVGRESDIYNHLSHILDSMRVTLKQNSKNMK
jgi:hypothetical protein